MVAMEPPAKLNADAIRNEKVKVLEALTPITPDNVKQYIVRGQYSDGHIDDQQVPGFLNEEDYKSDVEDSNQFADTETFVAIQAEVHNWRWSGVPFLPKDWKKINKTSN